MPTIYQFPHAIADHPQAIDGVRETVHGDGDATAPDPPQFVTFQLLDDKNMADNPFRNTSHKVNVVVVVQTSSRDPRMAPSPSWLVILLAHPAPLSPRSRSRPTFTLLRWPTIKKRKAKVPWSRG
jgi:hypothetical protein